MERGFTGTDTSGVHAAYFKAAIALVLTLGASWGMLLLWKIGFTESFNGISLFEVNAHGHAQIFGWVGLIVMGAAWQLLPRVWQAEAPARRLALTILPLMLVGIVVRSTGLTLAEHWGGALPLTLLGGGLELLAIALFGGAMLHVFRKSGARLSPANAFLLGGIGFLGLQAVFSLWHTVETMTATGKDALIWQVATWQAPLRDVQVHGLALFMIFGVALAVFPALWGVRRSSDRRGWWAFGLMLLAVGGEIAIFLAYRFTDQHWVAAFLMLPWLLLPIAAWLICGRWKLWKPLPVPHEGNRYMRAAWLWLFLSYGMLLLMPVYQAISGITFSHAYYGAIRHAVTVGFISVTMMGMAMRLTDAWSDRRTVWPTWPFALINLGCAWRVSLQVMTDFSEPAFLLVGFSAMLEVTALAWWGSALWRALGPVRSTAAVCHPALQSRG